MIQLTINGLEVSVEEGTTLLEAARFLGFPIPTLCHMDGLISLRGLPALRGGDRGRSQRQTWSPPALILWRRASVRTASSRVVKARKMILGTSSGLMPAVQNDPGPCLCSRGQPTALPTGV